MSPRRADRVALLVLGIGLGACKPDEGAPGPDAFDGGFNRTRLVEHLTMNVILPIQESFATAASAVPPAIQAHCAALDAGGETTTTLAAARLAWSDAVDAWERAEAILVGPAAMDNNAQRDKVYGWPLMAPCGVDRDVLAIWSDPASYAVDTRLTNVRSLSAIEFLLYPPSDLHSCAIAPTGWDALGADLPRARCRLAAALAADVAAQAGQLATAWRADGGNYVSELVDAGTSRSTLASAHAAVNLLSDGMFYVDTMTKDMKLGETSGISVNTCGTVQEPCIPEVELRYADRESFAIRINLRVLREVFTGTTATVDGPGFDDFLIAVGRTDLATRMTTNLDAAIAKADALPESFLGALVTHHADVVGTYDAVKLFTDDLKSQFLTVLALDKPDDIATDND